MNCIDIITLKFPEIQHVMYWNTKQDGTPWEDPYEGLIWENKEIPKPTKKELTQWAEDVDLEYRQKQAAMQRIYPSVNEQLDMLYHDKLEGTTTWQDTITAVKEAHPKPTE